MHTDNCSGRDETAMYEGQYGVLCVCLYVGGFVVLVYFIVSKGSFEKASQFRGVSFVFFCVV